MTKNLFHYLAKNDNQRKNFRKTTILLAPVAKYFLTSSQATATACVQEGEVRQTQLRKTFVFSPIQLTGTFLKHTPPADIQSPDVGRVRYLPWNTAHSFNFFLSNFPFSMHNYDELVYNCFCSFSLTLQFAQYKALSNTRVWDGGEVDIQVQEQAAV